MVASTSRIMVALLCMAPGLRAAEVDEQAKAFLEKYCLKCHSASNDESGEGLDVLNRDALVAETTGEQPPYVTPGNVERSLLWWRAVKDADMPPEYAGPDYPRPTPAERKILADWIKAGANLSVLRAVAQPVTEDQEADAIDLFLRNLPVGRNPGAMRFISVRTVYNNPTRSLEDVARTRAAVSKLVNGLSWAGEVVVPELIGEHGTVMVLNLDDYEQFDGLPWTAQLWEGLIAADYPYWTKHPNQQIRRKQVRIQGDTKSKYPIVRADWFVATVSRPEIYDRLLGLPKRLVDLETRLGVNLSVNFDGNRLRRGGVITSNVSRHNRLVERHPTRYGAYWRSYDFASSNERGNLLRYPLGPRTDERGWNSAYDNQAFEHAGGELIFNLPNGLQAYMLADDKDLRLDAPAPVSIVRDLRESAGTPEVVNGLSCIACHSKGIKRFKDAIRPRPAVFGPAKDKVENLYAEQAEFEKLFDKDTETFRDAVEEATAELLGLQPDQDILDLPEPVFDVARRYVDDMTAHDVAAEMGVDLDTLQNRVKFDPTLIDKGLGPLLDAKALKRERWEGGRVPLFQDVAIVFEYIPG